MKISPIPCKSADRTSRAETAFRSSVFCLTLFCLASCGKKEAVGPAGAPNPMDREQAVEVMEITVRSLSETVGLVGSIAA
ncbi:MAG: hypothetical protein MUF86_06905, partial [Akkermansiaceae bacterium]|nr:hypothetical protein [Akkermansiaceae bacterium]